MIRANELRIGNWINGFTVSEEYTTGIVRVAAICPGSVDAIGQPYDIKYLSNSDSKRRSILMLENAVPIPLTPEILGKCGFEIADKDCILTFTLIVSSKNIAPNGNNEYKLIGRKGKKDNIQIDYTVNKFWSAKSVHFLHQLQNLYYSLTGEELEVSF